MITNLIFGYCPTCESRLRTPRDCGNGDVLRCSECEYLMKVINNNLAPYRPPRKFVYHNNLATRLPRSVVGMATVVKSQPTFPNMDTPPDFDEVIRRATNAICPGLNVYR